MTGPARLARCAVCDGSGPGERGAPGLAALVGGHRVAWLCVGCVATPGRAWRFIAAVRGRYPGATIVGTDAAVGRLGLASPAVEPEADTPR